MPPSLRPMGQIERGCLTLIVDTGVVMFWEKNMETNSVCPNCGYCPHCGRGQQMQPIYPQPVRITPLYPNQPTWTTAGGNYPTLPYTVTFTTAQGYQA